MQTYDIITDSTCDLTPEEAAELEVRVLPIGVNVGRESFMHYPDFRELSARDFYAALRAGMDVSTCATGLGIWLEAIEESFSAGRDVIILPMSGTLTGGFANACIAAQEMREKYPEREACCVDSLAASLGLAILLRLAARWREEGMTVQECAAHIESAKTRVVHLFPVDSLDPLRRGGRISKAAAVVGSVLAVKPVLSLDRAGKISVIAKARGRKNAIRELASYVERQSPGVSERMIGISHADCPEDAQTLARAVFDSCGEKPVSIACMAPVLSAHCGPGGLALFFIGTRPKGII